MKESPRSLTADQQKKLSDVLNAHQGERVGFEFVSKDPEATQFAAQLMSIFNSSGWIIEELTEIDSSIFGFGLIVKSLRDAPPYLQQLHSTFGSLGITAPISLQEGLKSKQLRLRVGHNPNRTA